MHTSCKDGDGVNSGPSSLKWEVWTSTGFHKVCCAHRSSGHLVKMQILIQQVSDGAQDFAFLAGFQVMLLLLVHAPNFEYQGSHPCSKRSLGLPCGDGRTNYREMKVDAGKWARSYCSALEGMDAQDRVTEACDSRVEVPVCSPQGYCRDLQPSFSKYFNKANI